MIKIELKHGSSELKAEGNFAEVKALLETFWKPEYIEAALAVDGQASSGEEPTVTGNTKPKTKSTSKKSRSSSSKTPTDPVDTEAESKLANKIKSHASYAEISKKFITGKASTLEKCKLVLYFADDYITSGTAYRVLNQLGVKMNGTQSSKALSNNKAQFLTQLTNPIRYKMTASTEQEFKDVLTSNEE